jgi:hypothetical protein
MEKHKINTVYITKITKGDTIQYKTIEEITIMDGNNLEAIKEQKE